MAHRTISCARADKRDFGDNIYTLAKEFASDTAAQKKYIRKKGRNTKDSEKRDLNLALVQQWVKTCNSEVQRRVRQRAADYL